MSADMFRTAKIITSSQVVMASKSTCPFCTTAKKILTVDHGIELVSYAQTLVGPVLGAGPMQGVVFEIDEEVGGSAVGRSLTALTGQHTVPNIFIGGKHVGGCTELQKLHATGELKAMLRKAGMSTITKGERVPPCTVRHVTFDEESKPHVEVSDVGTLLAGRRVVVVGMPAAFSPTCSDKHLPGFVAAADQFARKGVDAILVLCVNDHFAVREWGKRASKGARGVSFIADGNGDLSRALGVLADGRKGGMGLRAKRFAALVSDGVVQLMQVDKPMTMHLSSAGEILAKVPPLARL